MTTPAAAAAQPPAAPARSVFAGTDVARAAGFTITAGGRGPVFDDDVWDFSAVAHLPAWLPPSTRRWDFTAITGPGFRLAAKELLAALLAPRHEAVAVLPGAYRVPRAIATCRDRLTQLTSWLNWLTSQDITCLGQVTQQDCDAFLEHRRYQRDEHGNPVRELSGTARQAAVTAVLDLHAYAGLLAGGGYRPGLHPWDGKPAAAITGTVPRRHNTTPPVGDEVLRPMLAAALHFTEVTGPLVAGLVQQIRAAALAPAVRPDASRGTARAAAVIGQVLDQHRAAGEPLPLAAGHLVKQRLNSGWDPADPLLGISFGQLAERAGLAQFCSAWLPALRPALEDTLARVGAAKPWARDAAGIPAASGGRTVPWTLPLHAYEVTDLAEITRTACMVVIAAITGMRKSELAELTTASPLPPRQIAPGLARYKLAGRVIKDQPHGGTPDEWTVIGEVHRAATLAATLPPPPGTDAPGRADGPGRPLFGRFSFGGRYRTFTSWVNGPAGQRLDLTPVPDPPPSLRALRRTLAIELAYRPGGLLAAKIALKHVSVATTEGYANRPGGAQARLLAEVSACEQQRNLDLTLQAFGDYQRGIRPSGPGARELLDLFAGIDARLTGSASGSPTVMSSDREVISLLSRRARTLHLAASNYCWFADPAKALCLRLAGTPDAAEPLAGLCDSARCPQATHHPCHRDVWASHADSTATFLGALGPTRRAEKNRLQPEHARSLRILAQIDTAATVKD